MYPVQTLKTLKAEIRTGRGIVVFYMLATLFFVGCLLLIAGIITLIVALITKKKKKIGLYLILAGAIGFFVAPTIEGSMQNNRSARQKTHESSKNHTKNSHSDSLNKIYKVKIKSIKTSGTDWIVEGTTNAPDGTKLVAIDSKNDGDEDDSDFSQLISKSNLKSDSSAVIKNGQFKGKVSGVSAYNENKVGDKFNIYIAGTKEKVIMDDNFDIKSKFAHRIIKNDFKNELTFTQKQITNINSHLAKVASENTKYSASSSAAKTSKATSSSKSNELVNAYKKSMNKYIDNEGWSSKLSFSYDHYGNQAKFEVSNDAMSLTKEEKRTLYQDLKKHSDALADMCNLEEHPKLQIITSDGQVVAETKVLSDGVTIH